MATIVFIDADGKAEEVEATSGLSLADAAIAYGIKGIVGDCGGACACGTCHVYVDPKWLDQLPPVESAESDLLASLDDQRPNSRLACQIKVVEKMSGLLVEIPSA